MFCLIGFCNILCMSFMWAHFGANTMPDRRRRRNARWPEVLTNSELVHSETQQTDARPRVRVSSIIAPVTALGFPSAVASMESDSMSKKLLLQGGLLAALMFPCTFVLGALFPLSLKVYCGSARGVRARVGRAYAVKIMTKEWAGLGDLEKRLIKSEINTLFKCQHQHIIGERLLFACLQSPCMQT